MGLSVVSMLSVVWMAGGRNFSEIVLNLRDSSGGSRFPDSDVLLYQHHQPGGYGPLHYFCVIYIVSTHGKTE